MSRFFRFAAPALSVAAAGVVTGVVTCTPPHPAHHHSSGVGTFKGAVGIGKSWGYGQMGQLGHGIETDESVPRTIEFLKDYSVRTLTSSGPR